MAHARSTTAEQLSELRSGWRIALAGAAAIAISMPTFGTYSLTFFIGSWQKEFGWSRESAGIAASCLTLTIFLTAPLVGRLCDRFGARRVACSSIPLFAIALFNLSRMSGQIWQLYVGYAALAALGAGAGHVCYLRTVASWFDKGRGMALGIAGCGAGLAAAVAPHVLAPYIDHHGWRAGWILLSGISLLGLPIVWFCMPERPVPVAGPAIQATGMSAAEARQTATFWLLLIGTAALGVGIVGLSVQLVPLVTAMSSSAKLAGSAATAFGVSIMAGRLGTGFLLDRYPPNRVAGLIASSPALGIALFALDPVAGAILFGVFLGLAGGAEHDIIGFVVARAFGLRAFSELFGWIFGALSLGAATGPLVIQSLRYFGAGPMAPLLLSGILCLTASVLFFRLGGLEPVKD